MTDPISIFDKSCQVLSTASPDEKAALARMLAEEWRSGALTAQASSLSPPKRPARPAKPVLMPPANMPRRRLGSQAGRVALLHAVAHIEFNAIDLAFDMLARFGPTIAQAHMTDFVTDWIGVGSDEARHFLMVRERLVELGSDYGELPAHDGLWEAAEATADSVLARLAVAPLVLEARGLDVTPQMIENLARAGDQKSARILEVIYQDEIGHVAAGAKWLKTLAADAGYDPKERFQHFVATRFKGTLKAPFNHDARTQAGFERDFYVNITH